jgi:TonB family protein
MFEFTVLASAALKGTILLAAASLIAWMLRKQSAAARHLVWSASAVALLALPVLSVSLPALRVPAKPAGALAMFQVFSSSRGLTSDPQRQPIGVASTSEHVSTGLAAAPRRWVAPIWAAGACLGLLQMLFAAAALRRLRRGARPLDCAALPLAFDIHFPVDVLEATSEAMPLTFGVFRPTVLLPAGAAEWAPERLRIVLLHELAHVRRGDVAMHLLARTALALYWWNPLAWFAWREFLKERERATDDLVLQAGARASDYAGHLLEVARSLQAASVTASAAIAMARRSDLEGRLLAILDSGVNRTPTGRRAPAAAAALAVALVAPFAAMQAQDPAIPPEADATIRAANSQKNHEILDRAAAAYERVAKYDVARKLLENSLAIREQVSGTGTPVYAAGLVKLGDLAARRHQSDDALAFYSKAVSTGDRPEIVPALLYLGAHAFEARDRQTAEAMFRRAVAVADGGLNANRALTWLAVLRQSTPGGEAEAELLYQRALAAQPDGVTTLTNYARLVRTQNRIAEAEQLEARSREHATSPPLEAVVRSQDVYRVGGGVTAPALLEKVEPEYSEAARAAKFQGTVLLYIEVEPTGVAGNIQVRRSLGLGLDEKAIEAVSRWRFRPGRKDGVPVPVAATVEIHFRLQ